MNSNDSIHLYVVAMTRPAPFPIRKVAFVWDPLRGYTVQIDFLDGRDNFAHCRVSDWASFEAPWNRRKVEKPCIRYQAVTDEGEEVEGYPREIISKLITSMGPGLLLRKFFEGDYLGPVPTTVIVVGGTVDDFR